MDAKRKAYEDWTLKNNKELVDLFLSSISTDILSVKAERWVRNGYDYIEKMGWTKFYNEDFVKLDAKMQADYNKKIIEGISPELIRLRELEVQMVIAEALKSNPNVIYMPLPMMNGTTNMRVLK